MAYVRTVNGPDVGHRYELSGPTATVGRHPDCEIALPQADRVSRHHAQILRDGNVYYIKDLGSRNGTYLNDVKIDEQTYPLRDGDRVMVCDVTLAFQDEAAPKISAKKSDAAERCQPKSEDSSLNAVIVDDDDSTGSKSTVMSKVEVNNAPDGGIRVSASLQAKWNALIEITRSLGKTLTLDEVLPQVLNSLFKILLQADRGFIVLKTDNGELVPRWVKTRKVGGEDTIRISRTIVKQVMDSKQVILSADATQDKRLDISQSIAELRIRSVMCAPLLDSEGNALGVIQVDTQDQKKRFQQEDLEVLASIAIQAGIKIDNAQLHEKSLRQKEVEQDLELAYEVQRALLPQSRPNFAGYEFYEFYEPADHIGGDYYDYVSLPDGRTAIVVADVVGHGVAAAMLMAKLSAEAKFCLASEDRPAAALRKLNDHLSSMQLERFVTLVMVVLDPVTHQATIVNAGHMAPIWKRQNGSLDEPGNEFVGLPVGIMEGYPYEQHTIVLEPGETLFMYTDGINEAMNVAGELFSIERLRGHLLGFQGDLREVGNLIVTDVRNFIGKGPQTDDMCLVGLARVP
ncbi:MAG: SpoIIE family protein phosphatase [Planctomycetota bacterium]|nr:SpoIIE family protein phosphatase [Planctomycetota bacterium]